MTGEPAAAAAGHPGRPGDSPTSPGTAVARRVSFLAVSVFGTGGVPRTVLTLAGHLARRGHDVEVISVARTRPTPYFPVPAGVRLRWAEDLVGEDGRLVRARDDDSRSAIARWLDSRPTRLTEGRNDPSLSLLTDLKLRRLLRSVRPGVLIATRPELAVATSRWGRTGVHLLEQEHMSFAGRERRLKEALRAVSGDLDAFLVLTEEDRRQWVEYLGPDSRTRVRTIPNTSPFEVAGAPPLDSKIVIAAGRLTPQKAFDRLIDAFAMLVPDHPDWRLHLYGKGRLRTDLVEQIERLGLGRQVQLMGFSDQFEARLAEAAVCALSSQYEGLPLVLLEAMSKGVPMVSFDCPEGPRQLIEHGVNGLLVDDGDVDALTVALAQVMDDDALRLRLGAGALASATRYLPDGVCEQWEALFDEIDVAPLG